MIRMKLVMTHQADKLSCVPHGMKKCTVIHAQSTFHEGQLGLILLAWQSLVQDLP